MGRNGYMLRGPLLKKGYDWWWHSFTAKNCKTGELRPFFIEYYVINPARGGRLPVYGQLDENKKNGVRPSYALIKAGAWGENALQIHNFYGISEFKADKKDMNVQIGPHTADNFHLKGEVSLSESDAASHPEMMSDAGTMKWDLKLQKKLRYSVGFGASWLLRLLGAFRMYWHVEGMRTEYSGKIELNGETYEAIPSESYGYQDKNWGEDYTNPWIWLSCNKLSSKFSGRELQNSSLDVGGGRPAVFGVQLPGKILVAFYYEGKLYEYNFSKFWRGGKQSFNCRIDNENLYWDIDAQDAKSRISIRFVCPKKTMLLVNYENPKGEKNHQGLWNGGYAQGSILLYLKEKGEWKLLDEIHGEYGGCEYGQYEE